jgi:hypothetical protein
MYAKRLALNLLYTAMLSGLVGMSFLALVGVAGAG